MSRQGLPFWEEVMGYKDNIFAFAGICQRKYLKRDKLIGFSTSNIDLQKPEYSLEDCTSVFFTFADQVIFDANSFAIITNPYDGLPSLSNLERLKVFYFVL